MLETRARIRRLKRSGCFTLARPQRLMFGSLCGVFFYAVRDRTWHTPARAMCFEPSVALALKQTITYCNLQYGFSDPSDLRDHVRARNNFGERSSQLQFNWRHRFKIMFALGTIMTKTGKLRPPSGTTAPAALMLSQGSAHRSSRPPVVRGATLWTHWEEQRSSSLGILARTPGPMGVSKVQHRWTVGKCVRHQLFGLVPFYTPGCRGALGCVARLKCRSSCSNPFC